MLKTSKISLFAQFYILTLLRSDIPHLERLIHYKKLATKSPLAFSKIKDEVKKKLHITRTQKKKVHSNREKHIICIIQHTLHH